jgi:hypothetical protein
MAWTDYVPGGSMINSFLHPEQGYEDAAKKMEDAWRQAQGFEDPYRQAGIGQLDRLNTAENQLLDPSALLSSWMSKYQESPFAQKSMQNAKESGLDTASSMGLMGSSAALNNIQQSSSDIMNKDRSQYLSDLMQKYMAGIGVGQNIYGIGANMAGAMGNQAIGAGEDQAQAAYGARNSPGELLKDMLAMAAKGAGQYYSGGAA